MTKNRKSHEGLERRRNFWNPYFFLPNARPVPMKVDPLQADVGATKWVPHSDQETLALLAFWPGCLPALTAMASARTIWAHRAERSRSYGSGSRRGRRWHWLRSGVCTQGRRRAGGLRRGQSPKGRGGTTRGSPG